MNANHSGEFGLREVTGDELQTVEGGIASFIPGLNPVVTLAASEGRTPYALPAGSKAVTQSIRSDEYVRNYG